jgi:hypothetical protein
MKRPLFGGAFAAALAVFALVSCGGEDADPQPWGAPAPSGGGAVPAVSGNAINANTGAAATGVTVTAVSQSATTDAQGNFSLSTLPAGDTLVLFTSNSNAFAQQARRVTVVTGVSTPISAQLVPVAAAVTFDPTAAQVLTVAGSTARVDLMAGSLRTAAGALPSGQVTAYITPISVTQAELLPGDYRSGTGSFESFGALDVYLTDAAGNALNLAAGQPATIRVPVSTRAATLPTPVPLMFFNASTGLWVQEGTATLQGVAPSQYYEGTVTHFTNWAAAQQYTASRATVCVHDAVGAPVANARVTSEGIDYSGIGIGTTDAQGSAAVPMKQGAQAAFSATADARDSNTITVGPPQSAADFTLGTCLALAAPNAGMTIKLTWGDFPRDLDSHLKGPNNTHVYYVSLGSLTAQPFARLDVDDVTSFGPEVVTITRLARGTYSYFVHNFSGTFTPGQTGSPARVELRLGALGQIHAPPAGEGSNDYWHVFDFTVAADCTVSVTPRNVWSAAEPANPSGSAAGEYCEAITAGAGAPATTPFNTPPPAPPPPTSGPPLTP